MIYDMITINRGSCVDLTLEFTDSAGAPFDLTGVEVGVTGVPAALNNAIVTVEDALLGTAHLFISNEISDQLKIGENWLRVYVKSGCTATTNNIRLIVQ